MQGTVRSVAVGTLTTQPASMNDGWWRQALLWLMPHVAAAVVTLPFLLLPAAGQAETRPPGAAATVSGQTRAPAGRSDDRSARLAQTQSPTLEVVQVLLVDPGKEVPLSLQVKTTGPLPTQSFIRIKGLPQATSLSEGHFVRPGVWAVPLSALPSVTISVPAGQSGRSELTISLVSVDNRVLAETTTTLVVGAASLFPVKPPAAAAPANEPTTANVKVGADVTLRMKGGGFELRGRLKSYDGSRYVIENRVFGTMTLDAGNMECIGPGCPDTAAPGPAVAAVAPPPSPPTGVRSNVIGVHGSNVIGWELMPSLIRGYVSSTGGATVTVAGANPLEERYRLRDAKGAETAIFDLKRYGTNTAFTALENGTAQIGMSSRPISDEEAARLAKAGTPSMRSPQHEHVLALDGLLVIVSQENPAVSLSTEDIAKIFSGQVTDWSEVGLPPGKIAVYSASRQSGTFSTFNALVLQPRNLALAASAKLLLSNAEVSDAVAADPNGIGLSSFAFLRNAKALNVESSCGLITRPSVFTVKTEEYPLTRRLYLYTTGRPTSPHVQGLVGYALSQQAQPLIAGAQFVDQSPDSLGFDDQGGRIAYALNASNEDFDIAQMRQLISDMNGARRLSITFRFRTASIELDTKARADVDRLADLVRKRDLRGKQLLLLGFADAVGPYLANAALSVRRATQVRDTLLAVAKGAINPSLIVHKGYSELAPVACNDQLEGRNLNRRVEVWIRE
jgi:phosphate transport system substrate-binding protein